MAHEFKINNALQIRGTHPILGITDSSDFTNDSSYIATVNAIKGYVDTHGGGSYTLPIASDLSLGGIKIGSGLSIDSSGILTSSAAIGNFIDLPEITVPNNPSDGYSRLYSSINDGNSKMFFKDSSNNKRLLNYSTNELDLSNWTLQSSPSDNFYQWKSVIYGNGIYVAVGYDTSNYGSVMTSTNSINWTLQSSPSDKLYQWKSITYGNGIYVAVGYDTSNYGSVMTSTDSTNWTLQSSPSEYSNIWDSITYGNNTYVVVGYDTDNSKGLVMTSIDSSTWTLQQSPSDNLYYWYSTTYGNGIYTAVGTTLSNEGIVMTSNDSSTWILQQSPSDNSYIWNSITYGDNMYVAVGINDSGNYGAVMTSTDSSTWILQQSPSDNSYYWYSVAYNNGTYVAVGYKDNDNLGCVMTSTDSSTWILQQSPSDNNYYWFSVTYGNDTYVAVGFGDTDGLVMTSNETYLTQLDSLKIDNYIDLKEISTPSDPSYNYMRLYSKDASGTTKLFYKDSSGTETEIGAGGGVDSFFELDTSTNNVILKDASQNLGLSSIQMETDGGPLVLANMPIENPSSGEQSYSLSLDSTPQLRIYGNVDGSLILTETAVVIDSNYFCIGDPTAINSFRFMISDSSLLIQIKDPSGWVTKLQI